MSHSIQRTRGSMFLVKEIMGAVLVAAVIVSIRGAAFADDTASSSKRVTAWLHVGDPPRIERGAELSRNRSEYEQYRKTQMERIKSPLVLQAALNALDRAGRLEKLSSLQQADALSWLRDNLEVTSPADTEIIQISLTGTNARDLVTIVNAVKTAYLDKVVNAEQIPLLKKRELLEKQYNANMADLLQKRNRLHELTGNPDFLRPSGEALVGMLLDVKRKQLDVDLAKASAEVRLKHAAKDSMESKQAKIDLDIADAQDEVLQATQKKIDSGLQEVESAKRIGPEIEQLRSEAKQLEDLTAGLAHELDQLRIELSLPPRVTSLDDASVPVDVGPKR